MTNRLETIATRQRTSRIRDLFFVAVLGLAAAVSISSVTTAADVANVHAATR